ncbi:MAG: alpha/beta fold hydrolase [Burkholderiaceae bacterium]
MPTAHPPMRWILTLIMLLQLAACTRPPGPRGSVEELFPQPATRPELTTVRLDGMDIAVARGHGKGTTPILFVHGSPGSWTSWAHYLDNPALDGFGARIAMDRPGFGASAAAGVMPDLRRQAALLAELIPPGPPAVLVGHSLGGPLIAWMAIDHPEKVCGAVMLAGSMAPELEGPRWYNLLANNWIAHRLLAPAMSRSNREMMVLQAELQKLDAALPQLQRPIIAMQGDKDPLVDPRTADYLDRRAPQRWLQVDRLLGRDHFFLWTEPRSVVQQILKLNCAAPRPS